MQNHGRTKLGWLMLALWAAAVLGMIVVWALNDQEARPKFEGATFVMAEAGWKDV